MILRRRGWDVVVATTVADALSHLENPPTWVILDLMLPDGDGLSVLHMIRSAGLPSRVAVTTGVADPDRLDAVSALLPEALLRKPIDVAELLRSLDPA